MVLTMARLRAYSQVSLVDVMMVKCLDLMKASY